MNEINSMMSSHFLRIVCLCILVSVQPTRSKNYCEEREKSFLSLNIAEDLITRAKYLFPNCTDTITNTSECGAKEKANALLDMSKKLIVDSKKYYPSCHNVGTEEPETTQSIITTSISTQTTPTEPPTTQPPTTQPLVYPKDCSELFQNGQNVSGVYTIWSSSSLFPNRSLEVFCDMDTDGGGWTVIQRRGNFTTQENFIRPWKDYKVGFGNLKKDFWLGNDNLFILSNQGKYAIRFDLEDVEGETAFALYKTFYIEDEDSEYKLHIRDYSGTAGDSMTSNSGHGFSTRDKGSERVCGEVRGGGWWYWDWICGHNNLNGKYMPGMKDAKSNHWNQMKEHVGLAASEIKIKAIAQ